MKRGITLGASGGTLEESASQTLTVNSVISGANALTKGANNSMVVLGANNANSSLMVNGGTVSFASDGIGSAEPLGAYPSSTTAAAVTLNGGGLLDTTTATIAANRGITLGSSGGTLDASSSQTLTVNSVITGAYALTKGANSGTVKLSGVNTYSGATTISAGTLTIGGSGQLNSGTYSANISDSGTFNYNSSVAQTLSGTISGGGALTCGAGTLTLSGANTYGGGTTLNAGQLNINNAGSGGTSSAIGTGTFTIGGSKRYLRQHQRGGHNIVPGHRPELERDICLCGIREQLDLWQRCGDFGSQRHTCWGQYHWPYFNRWWRNRWRVWLP